MVMGIAFPPNSKCLFRNPVILHTSNYECVITISLSLRTELHVSVGIMELLVQFLSFNIPIPKASPARNENNLCGLAHFLGFVSIYLRHLHCLLLLTISSS